MATRYILNIGSNDELHTVIKKCNTNFKAIMSQVEKTSKNGSRQREEDMEDINEDLGEAINDIVRQLGEEAELRRTGDDDLSDAIETVDNKFADYTETTDLAAVALSGDYEDLATKPTDPINSAYLTFDATYDPNVSIGGTWVSVGTLAIGSETIYAWKHTA